MKRRRAAAPHIAIVGTGLIGASIGLACRRGFGRGVRITGWDSDPKALREALRKGAITHAAASLGAAVEAAEVVVLAAPLEATVAMLPATARCARRGALIVDVAGVKRPVITAARRALRNRPGVAFVSGHPLAGREVHGPRHADAAIFSGRPFALIEDGVDAGAMRRAAAFVRRLGAKPVRLKAADHDRIIAVTSVLPQLTAVALALAVSGRRVERARLAGPGYLSTTRLAESPYHVWAGVLAANRKAVMSALGRLRRALRAVESAAQAAGGRPMERLFRRAAVTRRRVAGA